MSVRRGRSGGSAGGMTEKSTPSRSTRLSTSASTPASTSTSTSASNKKKQKEQEKTDAFEFDLEDDEAEEEEQKVSTTPKKTRSSATATASTSSSSAKSKSKAKSRTSHISDDEEDVVEEKGVHHDADDDVEMADAEDMSNGHSSSFPRRSLTASSSTGSNAKITPDDIKAVINNKEALAKQLKRLNASLSGVTQRDPTSNDRAIAALLMDRQIAKHKSQEVRAYAAVCLVDLCHLTAPMFPFPESKVKLAFDLFIDQLTLLSQPSHPESNAHLMLLETMNAIHLPSALVNMADGETVLVSLFQLFFALAMHDLSSSYLRHIRELMAHAISNMDPIPSSILDEILRHFTPTVMTENEGGAKLAIQLVNDIADLLERPIASWLKLLLLDKDSNEVDTTLTDHSDQISILAQLTIHCNPAMSTFQHYAIELLESLDDAEREIYTDLYGQVFSSVNVSSQNPTVMEQNQPLFEAVIARFRDRSPKIRHCIAKSVGNILVRQLLNQANMEKLHNLIVDTCNDKDETVRQAIVESVKIAGLAEPESITPRIIAEVLGRVMDKKWSVRQSAAVSLAELFSHYCAPHWRQMQQSPKNVNQYLLIPRKLVLSARSDIHMAMTITALIDEKILGTDESIELRTRALIGLFMSLEEKKSPAANDGVEVDRYEARRVFETNILGLKQRVHKLVNELLDMHKKATAARTGSTPLADKDRFDHAKQGHLTALARHLIYENDATVEDVAVGLHTIIFEAKDKNIHKYLRALANPLTEYQQIRLAQSSLTSAVRVMAAGINQKGKKSSNYSTIAARLGLMLSMSILPIECVEMIFRELAKGIERRSPVLKPCQELLLLISHTFPILLTHPGTMDAILLSITTNDHNNTTNALKLLKAIREQKIIQHANKKTVAQLLATLKHLALNGSFEQAQLAVECIINLWCQPQSSEVKSHDDAEALNVGESEGDVILTEILTEHVDDNLAIDSPRLVTALAVASKVARLNFPLFRHLTDVRTRFLTLVNAELLPADAIVEYQQERQAGIELVQNFLYSFGQSGGTFAQESTMTSAEMAISPKSLLAVLIKIIKLDGRYPIAGMSTAQQLAQISSQSVKETDESQVARYEFLLVVAFALLELLTVQIYHRFFVHPSPEAIAQYKSRHDRTNRTDGDDSTTNLLASPKSRTHASTAPLHRFSFHILPIAYLAFHHLPELSKRFLQRVLELMKTGKLSYSLYVTILVLGTSHPEEALVAELKTACISFTRRQRQTALLYERRHQAHQQQEVAAAQAAESEKKKTSRKKKKSTDEAEEEEDEPAGITRPPKVAHGLMPEYALADLIYVLSYNPQFNDHIGLKPTREQLNDIYQSYDDMLKYIDFFLDCLLFDGPESGGRHFNLLLTILTRIRESEDIRDPSNSKIYKLAELAVLSVQRRSKHDTWNSAQYDDIQLSSFMWARRDVPPLERYLPVDYKLPPVTDEEKRVAKRKSLSEVNSTPTKKPRHRKSTHTEDEGDESESDDDEITSPRSARKKKASTPLKPEATPTRGRLQREAKSAVKYTEGESEDEFSDVIEVKPRRIFKSPASGKKSSANHDDDDDDGDEPMISPKRHTGRRSRSPADSPKDEDEDEEDETMHTPKKGRATQSSMKRFFSSASKK